MSAVKVYGKVQEELAREFAEKVGGSVVLEGGVLRFDAEDVVDLKAMAADAESYWQRMRKTAKAKAACSLREKFAAIEASERYAMSFIR